VNETTQQAPDEARTSQAREPRFALANDEDEIAHIVCCREPSWEVAFCGEANDRINMNATMVCTLCLEVARSRRPDWDMCADPPMCPEDGEPCPDEHEIDLRILREVSP
jgi:hypothetical protein